MGSTQSVEKAEPLLDESTVTLAEAFNLFSQDFHIFDKAERAANARLVQKIVDKMNAEEIDSITIDEVIRTSPSDSFPTIPDSGTLVFCYYSWAPLFC